MRKEGRTTSSITVMHMRKHSNKFILSLAIGSSALFFIDGSFAPFPLLVQTRSENRFDYNGNSHFLYSNNRDENHSHRRVGMILKKKRDDYDDGISIQLNNGEEERKPIKDHTNACTDTHSYANINMRRRFLQQVVATTATATAASFVPTTFINKSQVEARADDNVDNDGNEISDTDAKEEIINQTVQEEKENTLQKRKTKTDSNPALDARYFIAGGGCASISHGLATPFDVIKTKIQSQPDVYDKGFLQTAQTLIDTKNGGGPAALLTGLTPTVVGFGLEGAVKFGVYESLKPVCMTLLHSDDKTLPYLLASIGAGAVASIMLCPMERARIRLVTEEKKVDTNKSDNDDELLSDSSSPGLFGGIGPMIQEEGITSIFFGYPAMLFKQVPYTITKQCSFDIFASAISVEIMSLAYFGSWPTPEIRFLSTVTAAFLASILACTVSQPGDIILTKKFKGNNSKGDVQQSVLEIAGDIYKEKGLNGFYAGYSARLAHVAAIVTSQLVLYDFLKQLLGLPATISA